MQPHVKPPTGMPMPMAYPQLCALARQQLLADPTMPDSEWRARIKDRLVQLGFAYPHPDQFAAALAAVEYIQRRPRPAMPLAAVPRRDEPVAPIPTARRTSDGWTRLGDIAKKVWKP